METSDEILVALAQTGDGAAFEQLITRHYDLVLRLGYRMLGSQGLAEDLAQEVCAGLATKIIGFRAEAKFTTWLYRISINAANDMLRKIKTQRTATDAWGDVAELTQGADQQKRSEMEWLAQAMRTLSADLRETLVLVLTEDMTHAQAATVLNISEGTVSWRMSEAKKHLRTLARQEEAVL